MDFKKQFRGLYTRFLKNCRVTLSGEINILTRDFKESILLDEALYQKVVETAKEAQSQTSIIKLEVSKELQQISIKLFSYNALCEEEDFFEVLKLQLENFVSRLVSEELVIRVNLSGTKKNWNQADKFMLIFVNNEILYKVTETQIAPFTSCLTGRICRLLLSEIRVGAKYGV